MFISKKNIAQWVNFEDVTQSDIIQALNNLGFEVERVIDLTKLNTNLIVGQVIKVIPHPQVARLNVCDVNIGNKILNIVCGANNVREGIKVVVSQIGSTLANGLTIALRDLRGVISYGMICSFSEIGLEESVLNHSDLEGIIHLPQNAVIGDLNPLKYVDLDDVIFEVQLTLNRSDCLSMYRIAEELAAYFKLPIKKLQIIDLNKVKTTSKNIVVNNTNSLVALSSLKIKINNIKKIENGCSFFRTLQLVGIKTDNFYDALLNLAMLEVGQGLMAFDAKTIKKLNFLSLNNINEEIKTNSGLVFMSEKKIVSNLVSQSPKEYQVLNESEEIIFLSLNLDTLAIQNQLKNNSIVPSTILLQRLTKPVVPDYCLLILQRLLFLLNDNHIDYEIISLNDEISFVNKKNQNEISWIKINEILGTNFTFPEIKDSLKSIGCQVFENKKEHFITVINPKHRNDLNNINDYSEEVARIMGYNAIPSIKPILTVDFQAADEVSTFVKNFNNYLLNHGFNQVKTYSLTSKENIEKFNFFNYQEPIVLAAPLTSVREVMRFSLVESLVTISKNNLGYKQNNLTFFADDYIYFENDKKNRHLAFIIGDDLFQNAFKTNINNFSFIKGILFNFLAKEIGQHFIEQIAYHNVDGNNELIHPYLSSNLFFEYNHFATIATLHPNYTSNFNLNENTCFVELNVSKLFEIKNKYFVKEPVFKNWSKYNALSRDISFLIDENITYGEINLELVNAKIKKLIKITLIDVYADQKLKLEKKKSLTFNLQFNDENQQLDENKISNEINLIHKILVEKFQVLIR